MKVFKHVNPSLMEEFSDYVEDVVEGILIDNVLYSYGENYMVAVETPVTTWTSDFTVYVGSFDEIMQIWNEIYQSYIDSVFAM